MNPTNRSEVDSIFSDGDLTTLVDLQKFLADELSQGAEEGVDLSRAFTPLTDGLGIHGVKPKSHPVGAVRAGQSTFVGQPALEATASQQQTGEIPFTTPAPKDNVRPGTRLIIDPGLDSRTAESDFVSPPPPVPAVTLGRRILAGLVDQLFIFMAFLLALAITSKALSSGSGEMGIKLVRELSNPVFVRSAVLEFGMIWLGYLTLSLGFLEMTFGMWVWGLRVNYGDESRFWKKLARVVFGMFFYPAVFPTLFLVFRRNGKSLIDALTQSQVYRTIQN